MPAPLSPPLVDLTTVTADELVAELLKNSFVFLTGIDWLRPKLEAMLRPAREFFAEPESVKEAVQYSGTGPWRGWQPQYKGGTGAAGFSPMERYEISLPDPTPYATRADWIDTFGQWPAEPAELPDAWADYYAGMRDLASRLVVMIREVLDLPTEDIEAWTTRQYSALCVNHYLAQPEQPVDGPERIRPHTDFGGLTLLWGENTDGGLHVQLADTGEWMPVEFPPDTLLLQAGDLLHLWSRGRVPKNNHRVVNPSSWPAPERYSVVFFHHPDLTTWVAPELESADGVDTFEFVLSRQTTVYDG